MGPEHVHGVQVAGVGLGEDQVLVLQVPLQLRYSHQQVDRVEGGHSGGVHLQHNAQALYKVGAKLLCRNARDVDAAGQQVRGGLGGRERGGGGRQSVV